MENREELEKKGLEGLTKKKFVRWRFSSSPEGIFFIQIARPEARNGLHPPLMEELRSIFQWLKENQSQQECYDHQQQEKQGQQNWAGDEEKKKFIDIRVVHLSGDGSVFCSGADLHWMRGRGDDQGVSDLGSSGDTSLFYDLLEEMEKCPYPLIGEVRGGVYGGGIGLVALCDYVLIEEGARFGFTEVRLGLVPAMVSDFILKKIPRGLVGPYLISGEIFGGEDALRMGLIHKICSPQELSKSSLGLLEHFLKMGPRALQSTKKLIRSHSYSVSSFSSTSAYRRQALECIVRHRLSPEGQEGIQAFFEKRSPSWVSESRWGSNLGSGLDSKGGVQKEGLRGQDFTSGNSKPR